MMGRRQKLISGDEVDVVLERRFYCYLVNHPKNVKRTKRKLNKRFRRLLRLELQYYKEDL